MARRLALGLLLLSLIATAPAAGDDVYTRKQTIDDQIQSLHDRIAGARAQEGVLTSRISALNGQIRTLEGQVSSAHARDPRRRGRRDAHDRGADERAARGARAPPGEPAGARLDAGAGAAE